MPLLEAVGIFDLGTRNPLGHAGQPTCALRTQLPYFQTFLA